MCPETWNYRQYNILFTEKQQYLSKKHPQKIPLELSVFNEKHYPGMEKEELQSTNLKTAVCV